MKTFRVHTDEQIAVWQRVTLNIEVESERELQEILNEPDLFKRAMKDGRIEYIDVVDQYWETEDHKEWDHSSSSSDEILRSREAV
jgi:hypothetical protein